MKQNSQKAWIVWGEAMLLTLLLGMVDWQTGHDLNFFVFYFLPIGLSAWFLGFGASIVMSIICAITWFNADHFTGTLQPSSVHAVWNTMIRLCSFLVIGWATARIRALLIIEHQAAAELRKAMSQMKVLQGLVPICAQCKKIRDDQGAWHQLEAFITDHSEAQFSHGYCPDCARRALEEAGLGRR